MSMKELAMCEETSPDEGRSPCSDKGDNSPCHDGCSSKDVLHGNGEMSCNTFDIIVCHTSSFLHITFVSPCPTVWGKILCTVLFCFYASYCPSLILDLIVWLDKAMFLKQWGSWIQRNVEKRPELESVFPRCQVNKAVQSSSVP